MPQELAALDLLDGVGVVGICLIIVWAIATGRLVTRREHGEALKAIARKDEQIAEKDKQLGYLSEVGRVVEQFTRGLQREMDP